jgi:hypothetical protein
MIRSRARRGLTVTAAGVLVLVLATFAAPALADSPGVPVVYHGGSVMRDVRVHTIFWAPAGFQFSGAPDGRTLGYKAMIQQFLSDVAHDSGSTANEFSLLTQYGDGAGPGRYQISYNPGADSIDAADPFPPRSSPCPPGFNCVTDHQVQQEVDRVIGRGASGGRGLSDIWFVFLPPAVDECVSHNVCATAFVAYHATANTGHGHTIYSMLSDPLIRTAPHSGHDPEGNPEAESVIGTLAHETLEAITDPVGTAWTDPNGMEIADKCEQAGFGPPLGFARDSSEFNQVINGHRYLLPLMWSNPDGACVQRTAKTTSPLPLSSVELRQFSASIRGRLSTGAAGVPVTISLARAHKPVAVASARTGQGGAWGPVTMQSQDGHPYAFGDDRDEIGVVYGEAGQPPELIETGDGGNPFGVQGKNASGYTGWFTLDHGYAVHSGRGGGSVQLGPCSQTGVLSLSVGGGFTEPPAEVCDLGSDTGALRTRRLGAATPLMMSSQDNRSDNAVTPNGALVKLTIALGEPNSAATVGNSRLHFRPTGFPSCTAFLRILTVSCSGLVPRARYSLRRARGGALKRARASRSGVVQIGGFRGGIAGGDALTLTNAAGRRLTTLHVAHLRVDLFGASTRLASGSCEPGDYYGAALRRPPIGPAVSQPGVGGSGRVCPLSGSAAGLSAGDIEQTDDFSGGQTVARVPLIKSTTPSQGASRSGAFRALARAVVPGPAGAIETVHSRVSLTITAMSSGRVAFRAANVNRARGASVRGLALGRYRARWVLSDAGGDTRTVITQFTQAR